MRYRLFSVCIKLYEPMASNVAFVFILLATDFWVRKMRTFFSRIDFNKDGVLSQNDIESLDEQNNEFDKVVAMIQSYDEMSIIINLRGIVVYERCLTRQFMMVCGLK